MFKIQTITYLLILLLFGACSETPTPVVGPTNKDKTGVEDLKPGPIKALQSLVYTGYESASGRTCKAYLSFYDLDSGPVFIVRPEVIIHSAIPLDLVFNFFQYSFNNNIFLPPESNNTNTILSAAAARLIKKDLVVDLNLLDTYESDFNLLQFLRIDFKVNTYSEFQKKLIESLRKPDDLKINYDKLNTIEAMFIRIKHFDHYDSAACIEFKLEGELQLVEFK